MTLVGIFRRKEPGAVTHFTFLDPSATVGAGRRGGDLGLARYAHLRTVAAVAVVLLVIAGLVPAHAGAQGVITGRVTAAGEPVPFASVGVAGTNYGAAANMEGNFRIEPVPAGTHRLIASAVGFTTAQQTVEVVSGAVVDIDLVLEPATIEADGVTVTGTLVETFVKESPVKVDVVSPRYLQKVPTANVMEVIENVNGLYQQIDCAVCGTNNIRINGMDGPYTAVLIDGMPIMSSLATVYGLNGISPSLIQQIEIIKGPMSTLYGSEAMGGVINVITKSPQTAPPLAVNSFGTSDGEYALDVGVVPTRGHVATLFSGTLFYNDNYLDENGDGFADLTLNTRASLFGKVSVTRRDGPKRFDASARYYYEDRLGGTEAYVEGFNDDLRGSDRYYGETIRTHRVEVMGTYHVVPGRDVRLDLAFNHHDQDSYYGTDSYQAQQTTGFAQLVWPMRWSGRHTLLTGAALRAQRYDDNTVATGAFDEEGDILANRPDDRIIPGAFVQHEYVASEGMRFLGGVRLDYQADYGFIPSPRLSVKVAAGENTTLRLNGGTGFRIVNLFTEDHAAYTGARATVLLENLEPERSVSGTVSLQHVIPFGVDPLTIDLEGFYTYFTNKIEPDYSTPGRIEYANLDGSATTRGVSLTLSQSMTSLPISYTLGATFMDVFVEEAGQRAPLEFAPDFQGVANATYRLSRGVSLDYTVNVTGPMRLPEFNPPHERPSESPTFSVHNLQATKDIDLSSGHLLQVYFSVENLFSYTQPTPLVDPANPFGDDFDTIYVYGPIHGRCMGVGLRLTVR